VNIRSASPADITFMIALDRMSPTAGHWTEQQYIQLFELDENETKRLILIAENVIAGDTAQEVKNANKKNNGASDSRNVGFLVARQISPDWELENIVVAPTSRRSGLGKRLLEELLTYARQTNSESVFLEVRESNWAARALYEKTGFQQNGRRKSYYSDPSEDAILYRTDLVQRALD
jgi:ribosomal-protein-alanine acetyltransferase